MNIYFDEDVIQARLDHLNVGDYLVEVTSRQDRKTQKIPVRGCSSAREAEERFEPTPEEEEEGIWGSFSGSQATIAVASIEEFAKTAVKVAVNQALETVGFIVGKMNSSQKARFCQFIGFRRNLKGAMHMHGGKGPYGSRKYKGVNLGEDPLKDPMAAALLLIKLALEGAKVHGASEEYHPAVVLMECSYLQHEAIVCCSKQ